MCGFLSINKFTFKTGKYAKHLLLSETELELTNYAYNKGCLKSLNILSKTVEHSLISLN